VRGCVPRSEKDVHLKVKVVVLRVYKVGGTTSDVPVRVTVAVTATPFGSAKLKAYATFIFKFNDGGRIGLNAGGTLIMNVFGTISLIPSLSDTDIT
jgi:hypothetical protein